jgi:ubiquinone/menaquinone biosynthesis C-methylase UbiE
MREDAGVIGSGFGDQPDRARVPGAFDAVAGSYDAMVGLNSSYRDHLGLSARRMGVQDRDPAEGPPLRLLDLGCGTGVSTAALLEVAPNAQIVAVDASTAMLAEARRKIWPPNVRFVHARAEELAHAGVVGPFDGILAAYLVRNLPSPDAGLRTMLALLRPGAPLAVHEYSVRDSRRARILWSLVCWLVIIPLGRIRSGSGALYRYLWRSVRRFDGVEEFQRRMERAGFTDVRAQTMTGWQRGIVHTFLGRRPGSAEPRRVAEPRQADERRAPDAQPSRHPPAPAGGDQPEEYLSPGDEPSDAA